MDNTRGEAIVAPLRGVRMHFLKTKAIEAQFVEAVQDWATPCHPPPPTLVMGTADEWNSLSDANIILLERIYANRPPIGQASDGRNGVFLSFSRKKVCPLPSWLAVLIYSCNFTTLIHYLVSFFDSLHSSSVSCTSLHATEAWCVRRCVCVCELVSSVSSNSRVSPWAVDITSVLTRARNRFSAPFTLAPHQPPDGNRDILCEAGGGRAGLPVNLFTWPKRINNSQ